MYSGMIQSASQRQRGHREVSTEGCRMKEHTNRVAKSRGDTQKPDIRLSAWTIFHNKEKSKLLNMAKQ
jgi:hypothetical protein